MVTFFTQQKLNYSLFITKTNDYCFCAVEPYIEIENLYYNVTPGGNVYLQCKIEAYPYGVYYWQVDNGTIFEESSGKVRVDYYHIGLYEV